MQGSNTVKNPTFNAKKSIPLTAAILAKLHKYSYFVAPAINAPR
jgi:hypothetical protein